MLSTVALDHSTGCWKALCDLRAYFVQHVSIRPQRLAFDIESSFWLNSRPDGRHAKWCQDFGASPCVWNCMTHSTSKSCIQ